MTITGDIINAQAAKLWVSLPRYTDMEQPKWSNGWLNRFKLRFNIREFVRHGEGGSAVIDNPDNVQQMEDLRTLAATYDPNDILNMDETGLFWKLSPDRSLVTKAQKGEKKSKDRITIALTSNATRTDEIKP